MNALQIEITKLIGRKNLDFGCYIKTTYSPEPERVIDVMSNNRICVEWGCSEYDSTEYEIIGYEADIYDLQRWLNKNIKQPTIWFQTADSILIEPEMTSIISIPYDSNKRLLDQDNTVFIEIINFIKSKK